MTVQLVVWSQEAGTPVPGMPIHAAGICNGVPVSSTVVSKRW